MRRPYKGALFALGVLYISTFFAGFFAPYDPIAQNRDIAFSSPSPVHIFDSTGRLQFRPFVYAQGRPYRVRFFVRGAPYRLAGLVVSDRHLFGVDAPANVFLLGTDGFGRDQLSRLMYGAQISLPAGSTPS